MNKWECDARDTAGCKATAVGTGGAVGLRAIGWYFKPGDCNNLNGTLLCPVHRTDGEECLEAFLYPGQEPDQHCGPCKGEVEADDWQTIINSGLGFENHSYTEWLERHREAFNRDNN